MKKLLIPFAALALLLAGCNKDGTENGIGGDATPATSKSIVGRWYYPNELIDFEQQPEFDFKADGTVTGNYSGKWSIGTGGVLIINAEWGPVYARPYTMYNNTVLLLHFDVPELDKDGNPVINQGQGWIEFFYKDGKAAASKKADIQGKWENFVGWDVNGDGVIDEDEGEVAVSVKFDGDKFDLDILVWADGHYSGTYTYKDGYVHFHPTKWDGGDVNDNPLRQNENSADFIYPFIANGNEAYAYIMEGRGAWRKAK